MRASAGVGGGMARSCVCVCGWVRGGLGSRVRAAVGEGIVVRKLKRKGLSWGRPREQGGRGVGSAEHAHEKIGRGAACRGRVHAGVRKKQGGVYNRDTERKLRMAQGWDRVPEREKDSQARRRRASKWQHTSRCRQPSSVERQLGQPLRPAAAGLPPGWAAPRWCSMPAGQSPC
jgi:hypothetical protein